ncbi:MAG: mechanosensitive ion channel family protein [Anaerolineae bacterium]|nr:mechanosensitive ion channel family protein [Anaerolineae bacterium]
MTIEDLQNWMDQNPELTFGGVVLLSILVFFIARFFIARGMVYIAGRTETKYDDIVVEQLHPFRFAYIAPLLVLYNFTYLLPDLQLIMQQSILFLILWLVVITFNSLLDAVNTIYESRPSFSGLSIQSYLDLVKLIFILVGIILSISLITGESPLILLSGLGALTAVLLLVFRDTLLSLVASIQIQANDLVKEGDWVEVPSYGADGDILDISLHTIKIQNFDMTITVIPTYKLMEVSFKNWRGMSESGGRRIKRAISIDIASIRFVDPDMLARYKKVDLISKYILRKEAELEAHNRANVSDANEPVNLRRLTNVGTFRAYIQAYLGNHPNLHQTKMTQLVRQLAPGPTGLPLEIYVFTNTTVWAEYEAIQADIFDHLLAVAQEFGLRVFQQPTGMDFAALQRN